MAYGPDTFLRLLVSGKDATELAAVTALLAADFSFGTLVPLDGADYNGARRTAWGVLREARNVTRYRDTIRFETDGVPQNLFAALSQRYPATVFRLEYWCPAGGYYGCLSIINRTVKDYRFDNPGGIGIDRNRVMLAPGCVMRVEGERQPVIYRGGVTTAEGAAAEVEVTALDGTVRRLAWDTVAWKAAA